MSLTASHSPPQETVSTTPSPSPARATRWVSVSCQDISSIKCVQAPPIICGYNTAQHMYIGASDLCNRIVIDMDPDFQYTRQWDIKVTQYDSSQHQSFTAPPGCLQWLTGKENPSL